MLFIFLLTACCTSTNSGDDESAVAVSRTGAVCLSVWRQRGVCKRRCAGMATCLSPSVPRAVDPKPSLAARANRAVNGLPEHAVVRHLLSVVQGGTND